MIFSNLKISRRLTIGFAIVLLLSLATGIVAFTKINSIWGNTQQLYEHPFQVSIAIRDVRFNVLNIRRYMLHIALKPDEYEKNIVMIDGEESLAFKNIEKLEKLYLGDK